MKLDTFSREGQLGRAVGKSDMKLESVKIHVRGVKVRGSHH